MESIVRIRQETRDGATVWVKRAAKDYRNGFQRLLGWIRSPQKELQREAAAIRAMGARGAPVPVILESGADYLVLSDLGTTLERLFRTANAEHRRALTMQAAKALETLHRMGGWHGNAMLRNLTLTAQGGIGMFDFDHGVPAWLPLRMKQGYDLWQLLRATLVFDANGGLAQGALGCYQGPPRVTLGRVCLGLAPLVAVLWPLRAWLGRDMRQALGTVRAVLSGL